MPHLASEENAPDNLTDKVAQHSKDSTASDHPMHDENKGPVESATSQPGSGPGPQIVETIEDSAKSKDDLKAEAAELNK